MFETMKEWLSTRMESRVSVFVESFIGLLVIGICYKFNLFIVSPLMAILFSIAGLVKAISTVIVYTSSNKKVLTVFNSLDCCASFFTYIFLSATFNGYALLKIIFAILIFIEAMGCALVIVFLILLFKNKGD